MCTSSGGGSSARGATKEARRAREAEERRQQEIRNNMRMLDRLFEGGTFGANPTSNVDMSQAYFDRDGNQVYDGSMEMPEQRFLPIRPTIAPMRGPGRTHTGPSSGASPAIQRTIAGRFVGRQPHSSPLSGASPGIQRSIARMRGPVRTHAGPLSGASPAIQRAITHMRGPVRTRTPTDEYAAFRDQQSELEKLAENGNLFRSRNTAEGFDDDYFQSQADAYRDFATPQLDRQMRDAGNRLTYALSNAGTLGSSTGNTRRSDLEQDFARARANLESRGQDIANQSRDAIARERQNLAGLVQQGVPMNNINSQVADLATRARQNSFDDLGQMFQNATAGIGNFEQGRRFGRIARDTPNFGPPGGGAGRAGSGRVVG